MDKISKNFIYNLLYHVFSVLTPLVVSPYITRVISSDLLGRNAYINAEVTYFCIFGSLGIATLGVRHIASGNYKDNHDELNNRFWKLYYSQLTMFIIVISIYVIYFLCFRAENRNIYILYLFYLISMMFDITWLFQGLENFRFIALRNICIRIISTLLILVLVTKSYQIGAYIACLYIPQFIFNIAMFISAKKLYGIKPIKYVFDIEIWKSSILLLIPTIAISIYTILDRIILGLYRPETDVAIYEQGQVLIRTIQSVLIAWSTVVLPKLANSYNNNKKDVNLIVDKSVKSLGFITGGLFWGLLAINKPFIALFLPEDYQYVTTILYMFSPIILIVTLENLFGAQILISRGKDKEYTISLVIAAVVNCLLDLMFIPKYGIAAACISSVLAELIAALVQLYYCRKILSILSVLITLIRQICLGAIIPIITNIWFSIADTSLISICLAIVFAGSGYIGLTLIIKKVKRA